jgi:hypothetical protein
MQQGQRPQDIWQYPVVEEKAAQSATGAVRQSATSSETVAIALSGD